MKLSKTTVIIVDDHPVLRRGLKAFIDQDLHLQVRKELASIDQTVAYLEKCQRLPQVALIDLSLADGNGLDLIKTISVRYSKINTLVLSMLEESVFAARSLAAGARGYIMKSESPDQILTAIKEVACGRLWLSQHASMALIDKQILAGRMGETPNKLSHREREVLSYISQGLKSSEIACVMGISSKTVNSHKESLKQKLGANSSSELSVFASLKDI